MGKFSKSTFHDVLNRDLNWAYHEIITEALCVLWIGCQLSLKFGSRFFSEWELTRIDPDKYTDLDRLLWLLLGQNLTGCAWDDVVSHWKPSLPQTVTNTATVNPSRANAGYIGAFAMVVITVLLGVSVLCSACVNRHWRIPRWTQHLRNCRRFTTWCGFRTTCNGEDWGFEVDANQSIWGSTMFSVLVFYAGIFVFSGLWLVFCALPVVIVAGLTVACIGLHCSEEAVFPASVVVFCLLAVHCTGRIWGLWMNGTYLMQFHEMIRNVTGVRLIFQPFTAIQSQEAAHKTEASADNPSPVSRLKWLSTLIMVVAPAFYCVLNHCLDMLPRVPVFKVWMDSFSGWMNSLISFISFSSLASAQNESTSVPESTSLPYWTYLTCTECCDNYETGMSQATVMLSYYVDLHYPRWKTTYPALLALFDTVFSPVTERLYVAWMGIVGTVVGLPIILLVMVGVASWIYIFGFCVRSLLQCIWKPKPKEAVVDLEEHKEETASPDKSDGPTSTKPFCVCVMWADWERCIVVTLSRGLFWALLPYPVLGLIVPEQFHLPALLVLLSVIELGLCCFAWKSIWIARGEMNKDCCEHARCVKAPPEEDDAPLLTADTVMLAL
ncbi:uncharacterized protein LOC129596911 [Paramacrobiotus metropolitanus]|uniref:uncharacterized protein LOC129596911 n=1 Tax=Paramacrobiotus metropolitanus TaxID=2943436 RepID=UPI002445FCAF|nr:uncharacterized protein LOC129596911 [Paramacrobiotus metropolitanus]